MKKKTKENIGMFVLSLVFIGYGYVLGKIDSGDVYTADHRIKFKKISKIKTHQ